MCHVLPASLTNLILVFSAIKRWSDSPQVAQSAGLWWRKTSNPETDLQGGGVEKLKQQGMDDELGRSLDF